MPVDSTRHAGLPHANCRMQARLGELPDIGYKAVAGFLTIWCVFPAVGQSQPTKLCSTLDCATNSTRTPVCKLSTAHSRALCAPLASGFGKPSSA